MASLIWYFSIHNTLRQVRYCHTFTPRKHDLQLQSRTFCCHWTTGTVSVNARTIRPLIALPQQYGYCSK